MALSGTVTYTNTKTDIINGALRLVNAYDPENVAGPTANQTANAGETLNQMLKYWATFGIHVWERKYAVIFPQQNQGTFVLGSPGPSGDAATLTSPLGSNYVATSLTTAAGSGATTISVASVNSPLATLGNPAFTISNTYNIGIQLATGPVQWTTVSGTPSGLNVTLSAPLTGSANAGAYVYCYQTALVRPLRLKDGFVRSMQQSNDTPCSIISREEYNRFGMKNSPGTSTQLYYDVQANAGNLYVYPVFNTCDKLLFIEFEMPIGDITGSTDNFDLPQEWMLALKNNLAYWIAPEYEVSTEKFGMIKELASVSLMQTLGWDQEAASVLFQPASWQYDQGGDYK